MQFHTFLFLRLLFFKELSYMQFFTKGSNSDHGKEQDYSLLKDKKNSIINFTKIL